ncbi:hypothetical protein EDD86DRAFT_246176 [Gorgonomyces haynaldii]|nr:hypothetical protein EDD86DRAFT_246176 [Gorgonomyces haynaldii]
MHFKSLSRARYHTDCLFADHLELSVYPLLREGIHQHYRQFQFQHKESLVKEIKRQHIDRRLLIQLLTDQKQDLKAYHVLFAYVNPQQVDIETILDSSLRNQSFVVGHKFVQNRWTCYKWQPENRLKLYHLILQSGDPDTILSTYGLASQFLSLEDHYLIFSQLMKSQEHVEIVESMLMNWTGKPIQVPFSKQKMQPIPRDRQIDLIQQFLKHLELVNDKERFEKWCKQLQLLGYKHLMTLDVQHPEFIAVLYNLDPLQAKEWCLSVDLNTVLPLLSGLVISKHLQDFKTQLSSHPQLFPFVFEHLEPTEHLIHQLLELNQSQTAILGIESVLARKQPDLIAVLFQYWQHESMSETKQFLYEYIKAMHQPPKNPFIYRHLKAVLTKNRLWEIPDLASELIDIFIELGCSHACLALLKASIVRGQLQVTGEMLRRITQISNGSAVWTLRKIFQDHEIEVNDAFFYNQSALRTSSVEQIGSLFQEMECEGIEPDMDTYGAVLVTAIRNDDLKSLHQVLERMDVLDMIRDFRYLKSGPDPENEKLLHDFVVGTIQKYDIKVDDRLRNSLIDTILYQPKDSFNHQLFKETLDLIQQQKFEPNRKNGWICLFRFAVVNHMYPEAVITTLSLN